MNTIIVPNVPMIAARWWTDNLIVSEDFDAIKLVDFENKLKKIIEEKTSNGKTVFLHSNYGPCDELGILAKEIMIDNSAFPWQIRMRISSTKAEVSRGYGKFYCIT